MVVGSALVVCMIFTTAAPYFFPIPETAVRLIDQQQTILQSVMMVLVGYLWGNSAGNKALADTVNLQAQTANAAQSDPSAIVLKAGESATATATEAGTVIETKQETT